MVITQNHTCTKHENILQEKAKAIALGLDTGTEAPVSGDSTIEADKQEVPMDTETHLSVETGPIKVLDVHIGTVLLIY